MKYFIRYTENAKEDFERKTSYHNSDYKIGDVAKWNDEDERGEVEILAEAWDCEIDEVVCLGGFYSQELSGLCAFELDAETEEEAIEEAKEHNFNSVYNTADFPSYAVFSGKFVEDCPEGCVMLPTKIVKNE